MTKPAKQTFASYKPGPRGNGQVAIVIELGEVVTYIGHCLDAFSNNELTLLGTSAAEFNQWYIPDPKTPVTKTAELFKEYGLTTGATPGVIDLLAKIIPISDKDKEIMAAKVAAAPKPTKTEPSAAAPKGKVTSPPAKGKAAPAAAAQKETAEKKTRERGPSAASMFRELIMAGKLTDDEIFAAVQKEYNLDDGKRSYVAWYRNSLKKDGSNPPAPVTK